jgi:hypothetical protein
MGFGHFGKSIGLLGGATHHIAQETETELPLSEKSIRFEVNRV